MQVSESCNFQYLPESCKIDFHHKPWHTHPSLQLTKFCAEGWLLSRLLIMDLCWLLMTRSCWDFSGERSNTEQPLRLQYLMISSLQHGFLSPKICQMCLLWACKVYIPVALVLKKEILAMTFFLFLSLIQERLKSCQAFWKLCNPRYSRMWGRWIALSGL